MFKVMGKKIITIIHIFFLLNWPYVGTPKNISCGVHNKQLIEVGPINANKCFQASRQGA